MTHIVSRCCYLSVQVNARVSFVCKKTSRQINIRAESVVFFFLFCIIFFHGLLRCDRRVHFLALAATSPHHIHAICLFFKRELNSVDSMNPLSFRATSSNILGVAFLKQQLLSLASEHLHCTNANVACSFWFRTGQGSKRERTK